MAGQVGGRAARDEGGGGVAVGQRPQQVDDPGQRPGRRRVLDDRGDGAVEVEADGHLGGPGGDGGGVLGQGRAAVIGVLPWGRRGGRGRVRGGRLVPVASLACLPDGQGGQAVLVAVDEGGHLLGHGASQLRSTHELALGRAASRSAARPSSSSATPGHSSAAWPARARRVQATRAIRRVQGWGSAAMACSSRKRRSGSRATRGRARSCPAGRWSPSCRAGPSRPARSGSVAASAARSPASRKQATSCSSRMPAFQSRSASSATWAGVASRCRAPVGGGAAQVADAGAVEGPAGLDDRHRRDSGARARRWR